MPPVITEAPANTPNALGGNVTFSCIAIGIPLPTITWSSDSDSNIAVNSSTMIDFSTIQSVLTLSDLQVKDFEKYTCTASNNLGSDTGTAILGSELITIIMKYKLNCYM